MKNNNVYKREKQKFNLLYQQSSPQGNLITLGRLLERAADQFPDNVALILKKKEVTYKTLYAWACLFSKKLQTAGIQPRDKVILVFENSIEFFVAYCAIIQIGAIVVPLNIFLHDREFAHIIDNAQPQALVAADNFIARFKALESIILPRTFTQADIAMPEQYQDDSTCEPFDLDPNEMAVLLYTSGTTGLPKGVMLSSNNCITNVLQIIVRINLKRERLFAVLPLFHSFAQNTCIWTVLFSASTVILVSKIDRRAILEGLAHKPTIFLGVPALYGLLCLMRNAPLESVKYFVCGGDALSDKIRMGFSLLYRRKICNGYGLTETSPVICAELEDQLLPVNTVGTPLYDVHVKITDEHGQEITQPYTIGQLWVKGDTVMLGYYKEPELTAESFENGWFATGDLVYQDRQGRLVIAGRLKDLIIHKGINIYPVEIENVLLSHPLVLKAAVIGKTQEDGQEIPVAYVQLRQEAPGIEKQLQIVCEKNLASYKIPRQFICSVEELPVTATGKVDKKRLRAL